MIIYDWKGHVNAQCDRKKAFKGTSQSFKAKELPVLITSCQYIPWSRTKPLI